MTFLDAQSVADYLKSHPEFFERHTELLGEIFLPHPHDGRAIPLAERQILALRERTRQLEGKLTQLVKFGSENDTLSEKMHRLTLATIAAPDLATAIQVLEHSLWEDFSVPYVGLRIWQQTLREAQLPALEAVSQELKDYAATLGQPYCGTEPPVDVTAWVGTPEASSYALVPLRTRGTFGLLVLGSSDPNRFYAEIGTLYLTRLGELASMSLQRFLKAD
ncbi:MAG: DUF484 family protein [Betaproteobacteria bacterium]|nr:DUF484 family protein [Betaproteobacteria bacterium]